MKGIKEYQEGNSILLDLHRNHKKLSRGKVKSLHTKYIQLIRKAAYKGNVEAQYDLGLNYEDTNYFVPNPMYNQNRRFYWYSKAAKANHSEACNNLGSLYEKGEGCKKNLFKALELYKKAYRLGCSYAKNNYRLLEKELKKSSYSQAMPRPSNEL